MEKEFFKTWLAPFYGLANGSPEADNQDATRENSRCVGGERSSTTNPYSIKYPQCSEHHGKCSSSS